MPRRCLRPGPHDARSRAASLARSLMPLSTTAGAASDASAPRQSFGAGAAPGLDASILPSMHRLAFTFVPFGSTACAEAIACDGLVDGAGLHASHWAGNHTP